MKLALLTLFAAAAYAAPPVLTELKPRGAEIGRPFTLTLIGRSIPELVKVSSTMPASFTPVVPKMALPGRQAEFLVELKPDTAPGIYPIRLETPNGISNILLFTLGAFPEVSEEESQPYAKPNSNDSIETAEPVRSTPVVVNGTLRGPERDVYRITGKAGEHRTFEVEARQCGSAIDPVLRIMDGTGKQLARRNGPIDFTFPKEGTYYVEVTDARFSTQAQNFYRLKMGAYKLPDPPFPLTGRREDQVPDAVELMEPLSGPAPIPSTVNGRLDKAGEIDKYRFQVQPGQKLLFEMHARELGTSKIEAIINAYDANGKKLDSAGDKPLPEDVFAIQGTSRTSSDPFLNLTVPPDSHEITVSIEDLALRGGPQYAYRLTTRDQAEDFKLSIASAYINIPRGGTAAVSVNADRRGYDGVIQLSVANLPKGIHAEGGIIPNGTTYRRGTLVLTADPGVEPWTGELEIWGEGGGMRRQARGPGMLVDVAGATEQGLVDRQRPLTAPWLGLQLPMATGETALATLQVKLAHIKPMDEGVRYEYEYQWHIRGKEMPPKDVGVDVVGAKDLRIIDMTTKSFAVTTTKATDPGRYDLYITGRLRTDDGEQTTIVSRPIPFEVSNASK